MARFHSTQVSRKALTRVIATWLGRTILTILWHHFLLVTRPAAPQGDHAKARQNFSHEQAQRLLSEECSRIEQDKTTKMTLQHVVSKFVQGCCVLCLYVFTIAGVTYAFAAAGLYFLYFNPQFLPIAALYLAWMVVDQKNSKQGGRKVGIGYVGDLAVFRYFRELKPPPKVLILAPCSIFWALLDPSLTFL